MRTTRTLPARSICLNVPKTGSTFTVQFFNAADCLELKSRLGGGRLALPGRASVEAVKRIKRHALAFGGMNCRLPVKHAGYHALPATLKSLPKLCALRDLKPWCCSFYLYYTRTMKRPNMLSRAIRLLIDGTGGEADAYRRAYLLRHRREFVDRFAGESARADAIENVSMAFFFWFNQTIRTNLMMRKRLGLDEPAVRVGFLTFRAVTILFDDPRRVFSMNADELHDYFDSGRYRRDIRSDFILKAERLTDDLAAVMTGELGYTPEIVTSLARTMDRKNVSSEEDKARAMRELAANGLFERLRKDEAIYENYLLPLAGRGVS